MKGYRSDENINVQVLTPASTWNTRITIADTTNTKYTYTLTTSEYNSGAPSIRFVDSAASGEGVLSDVWIDYANVVTNSASFPNLATTRSANGDLWVAYSKASGSDRNVYMRFLDYPSTGWASAETMDSASGTSFTKPSIGVDYNGDIHAFYVALSGPQLYYNKRTSGTWGTRYAVGTATDNPTWMVRSPSDGTYGVDTGGMYWKSTTSETYHFTVIGASVPEFADVILPMMLTLFVVLRIVRRRWRFNAAPKAPTFP